MTDVEPVAEKVEVEAPGETRVRLSRPASKDDSPLADTLVVGNETSGDYPWILSSRTPVVGAMKVLRPAVASPLYGVYHQTMRGLKRLRVVTVAKAVAIGKRGQILISRNHDAS